MNYSNNAGHGLSAGSITLQNSKLTANDNGNFGITASGNITIDGTSVVTSNGNGASTSGAGLRASSAGSVSIVKSGAKITLNNNFRNALENYGTFTFEEGVDLEIIGNHEPSNGGGVYNNTNATMVLPSFSGCLANSMAACKAAPDEMPTNKPSLLANRREARIASLSAMGRI